MEKRRITFDVCNAGQPDKYCRLTELGIAQADALRASLGNPRYDLAFSGVEMCAGETRDIVSGLSGHPRVLTNFLWRERNDLTFIDRPGVRDGRTRAREMVEIVTSLQTHYYKWLVTKKASIFIPMSEHPDVRILVIGYGPLINAFGCALMEDDGRVATILGRVRFGECQGFTLQLVDNQLESIQLRFQ